MFRSRGSFRAHPSGLRWVKAGWKSRHPTCHEVVKIWEVYLRASIFDNTGNSSHQSSLNARDTSSAWEVLSAAGEIALWDAYCSAGGPLPPNGTIRTGAGLLKTRVVCQGGPKVHDIFGGRAGDSADGMMFQMYLNERRIFNSLFAAPLAIRVSGFFVAHGLEHSRHGRKS